MCGKTVGEGLNGCLASGSALNHMDDPSYGGVVSHLLSTDSQIA